MKKQRSQFTLVFLKDLYSSLCLDTKPHVTWSEHQFLKFLKHRNTSLWDYFDLRMPFWAWSCLPNISAQPAVLCGRETSHSLIAWYRILFFLICHCWEKAAWASVTVLTPATCQSRCPGDCCRWSRYHSSGSPWNVLPPSVSSACSSLGKDITRTSVRLHFPMTLSFSTLWFLR